MLDFHPKSVYTSAHKERPAQKEYKDVPIRFCTLFLSAEEGGNMKKTGFREDPFYPVQPFFVLNTEHYYKKQCEGLPVSHFYSFMAEKDNHYANYVIPDNTVDILFCCEKEDPSAFVCGSVSRQVEHEFCTGKEYFGARFVPGTLKGFLKLSGSELMDNCIDLRELLGSDALLFSIAGAKSFQERIRVFQDFMEGELARREPEDSAIVDYMLKRIHESCGEIRLCDLSGEMQYSVQYIRRCFTETVGMSPKKFCRQLRFQHALKQINSGAFRNMAEISQEAGYYDQAHMLKEFQSCLGLSPAKYANIINLKGYGKQILYV